MAGTRAWRPNGTHHSEAGMRFRVDSEWIFTAEQSVGDSVQRIVQERLSIYSSKRSLASLLSSVVVKSDHAEARPLFS